TRWRCHRRDRTGRCAGASCGGSGEAPVSVDSRVSTAPTSSGSTPWPHERSIVGRWFGPVGLPVAIAVLVAVFASLGRADGVPDPAGFRVATVAAAFWTLIMATPFAAAYLLAGVGLGRLVRPFIGPSPHALWVQGAVGVGLML